MMIKGLQALEAIHIVKQKVSQREYDQQIPECIRDQEPFVKGNDVVQPHMHRPTALSRNQILRQEIQRKIYDPAKQQPQMAKLGLVDAVKSKSAVINHWFFHKRAPWGCC